jgi:hypothetical protein
MIARDVIRAYKRAAGRLRTVFDGPVDGLNVTFKMEASRDSDKTSSLRLGDRVHRHAALLRPFMANGSPIELRSVWADLQSDPSFDEGQRDRVNEEFTRAERLSIALNANGRDLTARDIYFAYGEGRYFAANPEAEKQLRVLDFGPTLPFIEMLFHDACSGYSHLVFVLLDLLIVWERDNPVVAQHDPASRCIYCLAADADFGPEEHVIPESLVGDQAVLRNGVCASCNNRLSSLDQAVLDFEPIAFLRTVYGPMTKKGKFPKARFRDIDMERTAPRALRVTAKRGRPDPPPEQQPDGTYRFKVEATGRRRFDPVPVARGLFKIALGLLALQQGREVALDGRYNRARAFIRDAEPIDAHLLMSRTGKPHGLIQTTVNPDVPGTPVVIDIYGFIAAFVLEPVPLGAFPEGARDGILSFWLGSGPEPAGNPLDAPMADE